MDTEFQRDLEAARGAEILVRDVFSRLTDDYTFEDVAAERSFFYRGDIRAIRKVDGKEIYIEVKDDSRIADTGRILCEEEVYFKYIDYYSAGNMQSDYDIYCVVSQSERKIYILDFKVLQKVYTKGEFKVIPHSKTDTYCYLLDICEARRLGALIQVLEY